MLESQIYDLHYHLVQELIVVDDGNGLLGRGDAAETMQRPDKLQQRERERERERRGGGFTTWVGGAKEILNMKF